VRAEVGKKLTLALKLARSADTDDHREAWLLAEDACQRLGRAVARSLPALVVLEAACVRVRRRSGPLESEREEKRAPRKVRN
jgi:hypothetical protein